SGGRWQADEKVGRAPALIEQRPQTKVGEVGGAGDLEHEEKIAGGPQDGRESDRGGGRPDDERQPDARGGQQNAAATVREGVLGHYRHVGTSRDAQQQRYG